MPEIVDIDTWRTQQIAKAMLDSPVLQTQVQETPPKPSGLPDPAPAPAQTLPISPGLAEIHTANLNSSFTTADPTFDPAIPGIDDLVKLWYLIFPDVDLYDWQAQELYRMSGYVEGRPSGPRIHFHHDNPCYANYVCANGSGKDMVLIAMAAIGLPLLYRECYVVITSASYEQLKHQTEAHICRAIRSLHDRLGGTIFDSITFFHQIQARESAIKLFATDDAGRAEGWHPFTKNGKLVIIINEAKTVTPEITTALDRCHGVSHQLAISSPGQRSGIFYEDFKRSDKHPAALTPGRPFARRVDCLQCPHITAARIDYLTTKHGHNSYLVQTSLWANFYEEESDVIIPASYLDIGDFVPPNDSLIFGFGLDCAAGGDETVLYIRKGNAPIDFLAFHERSITKAARRIHDHLLPYRAHQYIFNADDGGLGRGFIDNLVSLGWRVNRHHNQSAALDKSRFLNKGAEMYWHVRELLQSQKIRSPKDEKTRVQLSTRRKETQEGQGKIKLLSKDLIRESGGESPDRADAFVLSFYSYRPNFIAQPQTTADQADLSAMTLQQLVSHLRRNPFANLDSAASGTKPAHPYYTHEQLWSSDNRPAV